VAGAARLRWLGVGVAAGEPGDPCDCGLAGPYGETLSAAQDFLFRATVEPTLRLGGGLSAGARLRLSNEDDEILVTGPQYLSDRRGSLFVALRRGETRARLGYADFHFTPLTLQRWDFADNPPAAGSGGGGGCGVCGGATRAVSLSALDDLGPDLTVEGLHIEAAPAAWLRAEARYGRLWRPRPFSPFDAHAFRYRRDLFGARASLLPVLPLARRVALSGTYLTLRDDGASADWSLDPLDPASFRYRNEVYGGDLGVGFAGGVALTGELARSMRRQDRIDARGEADTDWAALVELAVARAGRWRAAAAWQRLGPNWESALGALSYRSNLEGFRLSGDVAWRGWRAGAFAKRLDRVTDAAPGPERAEVLGGLLGLDAAGTAFDLAASLAKDRGETAAGCECERRTLSLTVERELGKRARVRLELTQVVGGGEGPPPGPGEPRADLAALTLDLNF
jgi:hypothetical protein